MWEEKAINPHLSLAAFNFTSDNILTKRPIEPLPTKSAFAMLLCGKPGSGKTNLLLNLLARKGHYYNQVFDRVYLVSPSQKTFSTDWFESLPEEQRFHEYSDAVMDKIIEECTDSGDKILVILDDCQNELRSSTRSLLKLLHNRRHIPGEQGSISVVITAQVRFPRSLLVLSFFGESLLKLRRHRLLRLGNSLHTLRRMNLDCSLCNRPLDPESIRRRVAL